MNKKEIEKLFLPIIAQPVWGARHCFGSRFFVEFGSVWRERQLGGYTITQKDGSRKTLPVRSSQEGQWSLLVMDAEWRAVSARGTATDEDARAEHINAILSGFNGLRVEKLEVSEGGSVFFSFGSNTSLWLRPAQGEIGELDANWSLHLPDGRYVDYTCQRHLVIE